MMSMSVSFFSRFSLTILSLFVAGCGGPRMKMISDQHPKPLDDETHVDIYINEVKAPHQEIAIIESTAYEYVDDQTKAKQLEELRRKARRLGANVVQDV